MEEQHAITEREDMAVILESLRVLAKQVERMAYHQDLPQVIAPDGPTKWAHLDVGQRKVLVVTYMHNNLSMHETMVLCGHVPGNVIEVMGVAAGAKSFAKRMGLLFEWEEAVSRKRSIRAIKRISTKPLPKKSEGS